MAQRPPKGTLASSKGANLLAELKKKFSQTAPTQQSEQPKSTAPLGSIEEDLKAEFARRARQPLRTHAHAPKPKRDTSKEYIKIGDPELRRTIVAQVKKIGARDDGVRHSPSCQNDLGEAAFDKLSKMLGRLNGISATHIKSELGWPTENNLIERRIRIGSQRANQLVDPNDGFFLGYDFGTSTTKVVARYPYGGVDDAFAIEIPDGISDGQPHLWPTVVWFNSAGQTFSLIPADGSVLLDSFKTALFAQHAHRMSTVAGVTMAEAAVAFLAMHIAYCLGAAVECVSNFKLCGINAGVPVAALKDTPAVKMFERVFNAGLSLVPNATALRLQEVKAAFGAGSQASIPYTLNTELAGAIAGYCSMPRPYVGGHMIIDCGSATLDMATFTLDGINLKPIAIYDARVEQLGADACSAYEALGATAEECRRASRYEEHLVYKRTLKFAAPPFVQHERRYPYQIILVGGGIHSDVHEPLFNTMETAFHRQFHRPQLAPGLRYEVACEAGRLILADGLARDPIELRKVAMPGDPPPPPHNPPEMITKDQV